MNSLIKNLIFVALTLTFLSGCSVVETGSRGLKVRFGKIISDPLPEGLYFYNPITTKVVQLDCRELKWESKTSTYSKDAQVVEVLYTATYNLDRTAVAQTYEQVGRYWQQKLIKQTLEGTLKEVVGIYDAVALIKNREEARKKVQTRLEENLASKNIVLKSFEFNNLNFDDKFEEAVKRKVIAVEQAKEAKNKTVRVEEESRQKIIEAKAEAESMTIRTKALSKNTGLIDYEAVQKWNGVLPKIVTGGSGAIPFINVKE